MLESDKAKYLAIAFVVFALVLESIIAITGGNPDATGLFANLLYGWFDNPALVALVVGILVNIFGYVENLVMTGEKYYVNKFCETIVMYEPLIILFSQALPIEYAVFAAIIVDILRRTVKRLKPDAYGLHAG